MAAAFILQAVNYNVASSYFPDMQCDLLDFFILLPLLSCFVLKFLSNTVSGFRVLRKQHTRNGIRKATCEEKKAGKDNSRKRKVNNENGILGRRKFMEHMLWSKPIRILSPRLSFFLTFFPV